MAKKGIKKIEDLKNLAKADLHIHTNLSDGRPTIEEVLEYIQNKTDLDVIAITDHDTIENALKAFEIAKARNYRFQVIIGEEVGAIEGHILGLFLKESIPGGLSAHETLKRIHEQHGIAIAAHPFEYSRFQNPNMETMDGVGATTLIKERHHFNAIEVVNATPTLGDENLRSTILNKTILGLAETGSSDAHILEAIGHGYTLFEGKSASDLRKAIIHHQTQAMFSSWTLLALIKYLFFFIPLGIRMFIYTIIHGWRPKLEPIELYEKIKSR